jgi:hypothetical protein
MAARVGRSALTRARAAARALGVYDSSASVADLLAAVAEELPRRRAPKVQEVARLLGVRSRDRLTGAAARAALDRLLPRGPTSPPPPPPPPPPPLPPEDLDLEDWQEAALYAPQRIRAAVQSLLEALVRDWIDRPGGWALRAISLSLPSGSTARIELRERPGQRGARWADWDPGAQEDLLGQLWKSVIADCQLQRDTRPLWDGLTTAQQRALASIEARAAASPSPSASPPLPSEEEEEEGEEGEARIDPVKFWGEFFQAYEPDFGAYYENGEYETD